MNDLVIDCVQFVCLLVLVHSVFAPASDLYMASFSHRVVLSDSWSMILICDVICYLQLTPQGGHSIFFLMGCSARGLKHLSISKDFSPSKTADLMFFLKFLQLGTHF